MSFEYNGNKEETDRIEMVAKEISSHYTDIDESLAKKIALLEEPITTYYSKSIHIKRLYNILFFTQNNPKVFNKILLDMGNVYNDYKKCPDQEENLIDFLVQEIIKFIRGERFYFPFISEYY